MTYLRQVRSWSGMALLLLLSSCASTPQTRLLLEQPPEYLRPSTNISNVAFFPQQVNQCGPAALATVLNYQGINIRPEELSDSVYIPVLKGSLQHEMIASARSHGLLAYKLTADIRSLVTEIDAGHPVLVLQNLAYKWWPRWHYAVVVGYDLINEEIILRSGNLREHRLAMTTFERTWQRSNYWAYVILKPGLIPATAQPLPYMEATIALENAGQVAHALSAWRSAVKYWPEQARMWMALANTEYSAGQLSNASAVLRSLITRHPEHANAWNNIAFILAEQNCLASAHRAINCALRLAPDNQNIRHSHEELSRLPNSDGDDCLSVQCPVN